MEPNKLKEVLEQHRDWLQDNSKETRANLSGADLRGANLSKANLSKANLSGAYLSGADLSFTCVKAFYIGKHFGYYHNGLVKIGCHEDTLKNWLKTYRAVGKKESYTPVQIKQYGIMLRALAAMEKLDKASK